MTSIDRLIIRAAQASSLGLSIEEIVKQFTSEGIEAYIAHNAARAGFLLNQKRR